MATIILTPASAAPGATITIKGSGFGRRRLVTIKVGGTIVATDKAGSGGNFTTTFAAPVAGSHVVVATNSVGTTASATLMVTGVVTPPPPPPPADQPPAISAVVVSNVTASGLTVGWHVSEKAQGWIEFGPTTAYGSETPRETTLNFSDHQQSIGGLTGGTTYHFRIHAIDSAGQASVSADQTVATTGGVVVPPPPPPPPSGAVLDTKRDGWRLGTLWMPPFHVDDAGFGPDSDFGPSLQQCSVDANNVLTITAQRRTGLKPGRTYASACIGTKDTFSQKYGRWLARIKIPNGQGTFPAWWTLMAGRNQTPPEVDIFEGVPGLIGGNGPFLVTATNWWGAPGSTPQAEVDPTTGLSYIPVVRSVNGQPVNWTLDFHEYGMTWTPTGLVFDVDGIKTGEFHAHVPQVAMYPILNLAMGSNAGYRTDATTPAEQKMIIDWVRIWAP